MDNEITQQQPDAAQGTDLATAAAAIEKVWDASDEEVKDEGAEDSEQAASESPADDKDDVDASADDTSDEEEGDDGAGEQDETGSSEESEEQGDDAGAITTLAELAEATEVPVEEILSGITHKVGEADVPLADMIASYQDSGTRSQMLQTMAVERQTNTEATQKQATLMAQSMQAVERILQVDMETPEMQALRTTDPGEWNARITEVGQKVQALNTFKERLGAAYDEYMEEERAKFFKAEGERLKADVPGWGTEMLQKSIGVIKGFGFSDEEVAGMADSRLMKAALQFDNLRAENKALKEAAAKAQAAARKVKKTVPKKTLSPGATKDGSGNKGKGIDRKNVVSLKRRLAKSHKVEDAAKVIEAMMT